jgi:hypothetical protein
MVTSMSETLSVGHIRRLRLSVPFKNLGTPATVTVHHLRIIHKYYRTIVKHPGTAVMQVKSE